MDEGAPGTAHPSHFLLLADEMRKRPVGDDVRAGGCHSMPLKSSARGTSSAAASFINVPNRGSRPARSSMLISVRCIPARSPSSPWVRSRFLRRRRRFLANCLGADMVSPCVVSASDYHLPAVVAGIASLHQGQ